MGYSPFFLGNLTYQYDGPAMMLSVVAMIYAITYRSPNRVWQLGVPGLLIAVAMGLYQLVISVFVGLCCIEVIKSLREKEPLGEVLCSLLQKGAQLGVGGIVYYFTAYQFYATSRGDLIAWDSHWFAAVGSRFTLAMEKVGLLFNEGNSWFSVILLALAAVGYVLTFSNVITIKQHAAKKIAVLVVGLGMLPLMVLVVPGIRILFSDPGIADARNLMGFSTLLVFIFFLSHSVLERIHPRSRWFLAVPVVCMLSFSYAYGHVLIARKELELSVVHDLGYDLTSHQELNNVKRFYLIGPDAVVNWIPGAHGALTLMPALRYVLTDMGQIFVAERLPRIGITNVAGWSAKKDFETSVENKEHVRVVDNKFYSIYLVDGDGYIVFATITDSEAYTAQP